MCMLRKPWYVHKPRISVSVNLCSMFCVHRLFKNKKLQWPRGIMGFMHTFQNYQGKISTVISTFNCDSVFQLSTVILIFNHDSTFQRSTVILTFNRDSTSTLNCDSNFQLWFDFSTLNCDCNFQPQFAFFSDQLQNRIKYKLLNSLTSPRAILRAGRKNTCRLSWMIS